MSTPHIVCITRHGERQDFIDRTWIHTSDTPYDPPLSENGHKQAAELAERLRSEDLVHIFSSPFRRTLQTANAVAEALDLPIKVENGASEALMAEWFAYDPRVRSLEELASEFPRVDVSYRSRGEATFPEDWEICKARCAEAIRRVVRDFPRNSLFVGHGASVSSLTWGLVKGFPQLSGATCGLVKMVRDGNDWELKLSGDTSHLSYTEDKIRFQ